jgi:hypothetical protein
MAPGVLGYAAAAGVSALAVGGIQKGVEELSRLGASKSGPASKQAITSSATPLLNAGVALPEQTTYAPTIPTYASLPPQQQNYYGQPQQQYYGQPQQQYYGQPQYNGGYAGGQPTPDQYYGAGMTPQAPYAAPPVDSFGPQDMGPAEQSFDAGGGGGASSFTREVTAYGDQDPSGGGGGGGGDGGGMPPSPDMVDDSDYGGSEDDASEGSVRAPRRRGGRGRRIARAMPDVEEEEEIDYADVPMDEGDGDETTPSEGVTADRDVAGLGFWRGNWRGGFSPSLPSVTTGSTGGVVRQLPQPPQSKKAVWGGRYSKGRLNGIGSFVNPAVVAEKQAKTIDTSDPKAVAAVDAAAAAAVKQALLGSRKTLRKNVARPRPLKGLDGVDTPMNPLLKLALWGAVGYGLYASLLRKN